MSNITVLHNHDGLCKNYTLYPLLVSKLSIYFDFTTNLNYCLESDKNKFIIIIRKLKDFNKIYKDKNERINLIKKLKCKYNKVFVLDDQDGTGIYYPEALEYADSYYKKQLLKDKNIYLSPICHREYFQDFYLKHTPKKQFINQADLLNKLKISWNIGVGLYDYYHLPQNLIYLLKRYRKVDHSLRSFLDKFNKHILRKIIRSNGKANLYNSNFIQARFTIREKDYQRKLFFDQLKSNSKIRTGYISPNKYLQELQNAKAIISPFGLGEICFRDFEAIQSKVPLIKPSMSHLETYPDIYIPNETYFEVAWDGSDLLETCNSILESPTHLLEEVTQYALDSYEKELQKIDSKIESLIEDFHNI